MLKKFVISLMILLTLVACSNSTQTDELTAKGLYDELCANITFDGTELTVEQASSILFLDENASEVYAYIANDLTSNIIAVVKTSSTISTIDNLNQYIASINQTAMNYSPEELEKIDNAFLKALNNEIVVFVICDDITAVERVIN